MNRPGTQNTFTTYYPTPAVPWRDSVESGSAAHTFRMPLDLIHGRNRFGKVIVLTALPSLESRQCVMEPIE